MTTEWECLDGNEAAARVAYQLSEVIAIYPITPASPMGEHCDDWAAAGRRNLWGQVPEVVEMQSEAGAAGALHGALQKGSLATTFTASQGLLLMIPNMFKIAGELTPGGHPRGRPHRRHPRAVDLRRPQRRDARPHHRLGDAVGRLGAGGPRLRARRPRRHAALAGCRSCTSSTASAPRTRSTRSRCCPTTTCGRSSARTTSSALRARGMTPEHPVVRGTAQNPDVFFQAREAANPFHLAVPGIVQHGDGRAGRAHRPPLRAGRLPRRPRRRAGGRAHGLGRRRGARRPSRRWWPPARRSGLVRVRLFQPFPAEQFVAALPPTVRSIAVLDRTKEPGAVGEPLYLDVVAALAEHLDGETPTLRRDRPRVIGGRYGLSSKELTPAMVKPIFDELAAPAPEAPLHRRHRRRRHPPEPAGRPRRSPAPPRRRGPGHVLRPGLRRHRRRQQGVGQDHRREHRPLRAGLLRLRLQEVGLGHRVAPALRARAHPLHLPHRRGRLRRLPPVRAARDDEGARPRPARRHAPAQQPASGPTRCGTSCPRDVQQPAHRQGRSSCGSSTPTAWPARRGWATASTP